MELKEQPIYPGEAHGFIQILDLKRAISRRALKTPNRGRVSPGTLVLEMSGPAGEDTAVPFQSLGFTKLRYLGQIMKPGHWPLAVFDEEPRGILLPNWFIAWHVMPRGRLGFRNLAGSSRFTETNFLRTEEPPQQKKSHEQRHAARS